jgi:RNA polymerase sigma factor (sigma-70 family)
MEDDAELLRRYAKERDETAFTELVRRHLNLVYSAALRQTERDAQLAEDITQKVFTDLARKAAVLSSHPVLSGWLYRCTRYTAIDAMRAKRRREIHEQEAQSMHAPEADSEADWGQLRSVLDQAMGELNDRDRDAVLLRFFEERTFAEVGTQLKLNENAARMRVDRALGKLHGLLARRGITSTTAALATALASQTVLAAPAGLATQVTGAALVQAAAMGGTATAVTGIFQLMTTTKTVVGVAAIAGMLAIGTAVYETQQAHTAGSAAGAVQQENQALTARLKALQQATQTAEQARAELGKSVAEARALAAKAKSPQDETVAAIEAETLAAEALGQRFLAAHPEYRSLVIAYSKFQLSEDYRAFYRKLGLTAEQIERFETMMLEIGRAGRWFRSASGSSVAFTFATQKFSDSEQETRIRETLGDANYAQFQEYERTRDARKQTTELASILYCTESPLSADQAKQVEQILGRNSAADPAPKVLKVTLIDWDQVMAQASGVLSARQVEALNSLRAKMQYNVALYKAQVASMAAARKPAASAN